MSVIVSAVSLCNKLCSENNNLPKKIKMHAHRLIYPRAALYLQMIKCMTREEAGFETRVHESTSKRFRFDVIKCPYCKFCNDLGCQELTKTFCLSDDCIYSRLRGIAYRRSGILGRGNNRCDFDLIREA